MMQLANPKVFQLKVGALGPQVCLSLAGGLLENQRIDERSQCCSVSVNFRPMNSSWAYERIGKKLRLAKHK